MEAWIVTDVAGLGAGLGKMDIVFVPRKNGNCLAAHLTRDGRAWVDTNETMGQPEPDDPRIKKIEISEELASEIETSFNARAEGLTANAKELLQELVAPYIA